MTARPGITRLVVCVALATGTPCAAQSIPMLTVTRDLRIDALEHDLSPISWLTVSPAGVIVVSQAQDGNIRFFDARGAALGTFGRKGRGPGEFDTPARVGWVAETLWVSDMGTRRFTLVSPSRALVDTRPWPATLSGELVPQVSAQRITSSIPYALQADGSQLLGVAIGDPNGTGRDPVHGAPVVRADRDGKLVRLVAWRPDDGCSVGFAMSGGGYGVARVPFCFATLYETAPPGDRFATVHAERGSRASYRVSVVRATGDTLFSRAYEYRPVPIPRAVFDSVIQQRSGRGPTEFREAWRSMTAPAGYPPIERLVLGRDATTWLEEYTAAGNRTWRVLDQRGEVVGRIQLPRTVRLLAATREAIWGTETDDDGLQHIVRYRVAR